MSYSTTAVCLCALVPFAVAQPFSYDEAVDGDLATDIASPTDLGATGIGVNSVSLSVFSSDTPGGDFDVFTFQIQAGQELTGIILSDYSGLDEIGFIAINDTPTFPVNPNTGDPSAFLGGTLFGPTVQGIGGDLLPDLMLPFAGGTGFSGPVGEGSWTLFVQQTGELTNATFDFIVVPAPASAGLIAGGALLAARRRR